MNLLGWWHAGPYLYQLWETEEGFSCECFDAASLTTLFKGEGTEPIDAIREALREAMRGR